MASRDSSHRRGGSRFLVLAGLIVLAAAAYTAGWFYIAGQIDTRSQAALASLDQRGLEATCANREVRGYPFRIGLFCDDIAIVGAAEGVSFSAGQFRSAGQIYNPRFLVAELDSPARLSLPDGLPALALDWGNLRGSVRLGQPLPERVSVEAREVRIGAAAQAAAAELARADRAEAHMRPSGNDLDVAARVSALALDPALTQDRALPPLSGDADVTIENGVTLIGQGVASLRGQSGTIRSLTIGSGTDAAVTLQGPVSVDDQGLIDADLQVGVRNPQEVAEILAAALPEFADQIRTAFSGIAALGGGAQQTPAIPVRIVKGNVSVGFLPVGEIPPL